MDEDEPLVEIQTDKATVEIPSPYAGTVLKIRVAEGEVAPVGAVLVVIGEPGETFDEPAAKAPSDAVSQGGRRRPASLSRIAFRRPRWCGRSRRSSASTSRRSRRPGQAGASPRTTCAQRPVARRRAEGRREPLRGVRRLIAEHMARAHREIPAVTWVEECDFEHVERERLLATVVKAVATSLAEFPELNARLEDDAIVYLDRYDIGVAVQTEQGLVVPVVRGADTSTIEEIDVEIRRLAEGARTGTLTPDELRGSTFTVTSAGKLAGLFQTPIVNHPEVAILSIGRIGETTGRARGRGRRASYGDDRDLVRPPRRRRRAGGRVRARGDRAARGWRLGNDCGRRGDRSARARSVGRDDQCAQRRT